MPSQLVPSDKMSATSGLDCVTNIGGEVFVPKFVSNVKKELLCKAWRTGISHVGQCFEGGAKQLRETLLKYYIEHGFRFGYVHNSSKKIIVRCIHNGIGRCTWRLYASNEECNGFMYIRKLVSDHTCGYVFKPSSGMKLSSDIICDLIVDDVRSKPSTTATDIVSTLKGRYGFEISYKVAWTALQKAKKELFGDPSLSYNKIAPLLSAIKSEDPSSEVGIEYDPISHTFKRCFVSFGCFLQAFDCCRPILYLDGTFLKTKFKGHLLSAVAKDGDQGIFPVAFAIVLSEDLDNWTWFLASLKPLLTPRSLTFISDRHQGIISAVRKIFPECYHGLCFVHLLTNLRDKLKGGSYTKEIRDNIVGLFRNCAYAPNAYVFEENYHRLISEGGIKVKEFLDKLPKESYSNAFFGGKRYGDLTSNAVESFNSQIRKYRDRPVSELIDGIRLMLMKQTSERLKASLSWTTVLCPYFHKRFNELSDECRTWVVIGSANFKFEVLSQPSMVVDINNSTCSCGVWQFERFPCAHAIAVILKYGGHDPFAFIDEYFHTKKYSECYSSNVPALSSFVESGAQGDQVVVYPPVTSRPPGRPRKRRIPSRGEFPKKKLKCSFCGKFNHNKRTCDGILKNEK